MKLPAPKINHTWQRRIVILFSILGVLSIFILASSVQNLEFKPGVAFDSNKQQPIVEALMDGGKESWLGNIIITLIMALFPISVIAILISKEVRKQLKRYMPPLFLLLSYFLLVRLFSSIMTSQNTDTELNEPRPTQMVIEDLDLNIIGEQDSVVATYSPPEVPNWQGYVIGFFTVIGLGVVAYRMWESNRPEEDDFSHIAIRALRDLSDGKQWEDAVIQCYSDMSNTISRQRRINRPEAVTPREFISRLEEAGLPTAPIQKLTRLFEHARYSNRQSDPNASQEAADCLREIIHALEIAP